MSLAVEKPISHPPTNDTPGCYRREEEFLPNEECRLIIQAQRGDQDAYTQIFNKYLPRIREFAESTHFRNPWIDPSDIESVADEKMIETIRRFDPEKRKRLGPILFTSLRHHVIDLVRGRRIILHSLDAEPSNNSSCGAPSERASSYGHLLDDPHSRQKSKHDLSCSLEILLDPEGNYLRDILTTDELAIIRLSLSDRELTMQEIGEQLGLSKNQACYKKAAATLKMGEAIKTIEEKEHSLQLTKQE